MVLFGLKHLIKTKCTEIKKNNDLVFYILQLHKGNEKKTVYWTKWSHHCFLLITTFNATYFLNPNFFNSPTSTHLFSQWCRSNALVVELQSCLHLPFVCVLCLLAISLDQYRLISSSARLSLDFLHSLLTFFLSAVSCSILTERDSCPIDQTAVVFFALSCSSHISPVESHQD